MGLSPICFFAYNRPEHTRKALAALAAADGAYASELFIFIDGPAHPDERHTVDAVRDEASRTAGFAKIHIKTASTNQGTVQSIVPAVSEIINRFGRVIVIEDDVIVSPQFLRFANQALDRYEGEERVMAITGYMFDIASAACLPEAFFHRNGSSIGWATWARAWQRLELDANVLLNELERTGLIHTLDRKGTLSLAELIRRDAAAGVSQASMSWSPRWFASIILHDGLCLYPRHALVRNIGFDGSGVRSPVSGAWDVTLSTFEPTELPEVIQEHAMAEAVMSESYRRVHSSRLNGL